MESLAGLPEEKVAAIKEVTEVEFIPHEIDLDYSYFTVGENTWIESSKIELDAVIQFWFDVSTLFEVSNFLDDIVPLHLNQT